MRNRGGQIGHNTLPLPSAKYPARGAACDFQASIRGDGANGGNNHGVLSVLSGDGSWPRRFRNEDTCVDRPNAGLRAMAAGAGGHDSGEVAAELLRDALQTMPARLAGAALVSEVKARREESADRESRRTATRRGPGVMLASTTAALAAGDDHFTCLWAGDSRIYLVRDGNIRQLTPDHLHGHSAADDSPAQRSRPYRPCTR